MLGILKLIFKTIINILTTLIFLVLILLIVVKVNMVVRGKEYFEIFGYSFFDVVTGSMEPTISVNDIVLVKTTKDVKEDDIITFIDEDNYVTHRVVSVNGDNIVTKGDANNANDTAIHSDVILGVVVKTFKNAGVWQKVLTEPSIIISVFVTLIVFDFAFSFKGFKNKKIAKKVNDIDLKEVYKNSPFDNLTEEDINSIYEKLDKINSKKDVSFEKEEKEFLDYTIRLDLEQIQKGINDKMNEDK